MERITTEWIAQQRAMCKTKLTYDNGFGRGILIASKSDKCTPNSVLCCNELCNQHRNNHGQNCNGCDIQAAFDALYGYETALPAALDALEAAYAEIKQLKADADLGDQYIDALKKNVARLTTERDAWKRRADAIEHDLFEEMTEPCKRCRFSSDNGGDCDRNPENHEAFSCWVWDDPDAPAGAESE